jgi:glutathione synthase/RimK-type ligase-like ATP-grasp enzyme
MKLRTVRIRTKNYTAAPLKRAIFVPFLSVARLGSHTPTHEIFPLARDITECNTVNAVLNSSNKLRMKECFNKYNIPQADWYHGSFSDINKIKKHFNISEEYQLVGKAINGFQGRGMVLINNDKELKAFCSTHSPEYFFIERFYNFAREYRLHATQDKVFLSWRKLRQQNATERWFFNSQNCNWVGERHGLFNKPANWDKLCNAACNAIKVVGLDIGAVDIRIQSSGRDPQFIICEVNSAPALAEEGIEKYREQIKEILIKKHG